VSCEVFFPPLKILRSLCYRYRFGKLEDELWGGVNFIGKMSIEYMEKISHPLQKL